MQEGIYLKLFVPEQLRVHGDLFYDWILNRLKQLAFLVGLQVVR
jgi:PII-like signaling protein